jgi:hypothetical protein
MAFEQHVKVVHWKFVPRLVVEEKFEEIIDPKNSAESTSYIF